jgi:hypothetical protein
LDFRFWILDYEERVIQNRKSKMPYNCEDTMPSTKPSLCVLFRFLCVLCGLSFVAAASGAEWKPAQGPLMTRWAKEVSPDKVHPEYPRPQMVRKDWTNLNGLWQYAVRPREEKQPEKWDGEILVPFAIESALSGVMKPVGETNKLWYRREFTRPKMAKDERLLLHFGAVDWEATVYVNGKKVGEHRGGYTPFSFDITDALKPEGTQELVVAVWDPTDAGYQPRGKQVRKPEGIWYTAVTGIWQTVWLEPVPKKYIVSIKLVPDLDKDEIEITATTSNATEGDEINIGVYPPDVKPGEKVLFKPYLRRGKPAAPFRCKVHADPSDLWTPANPSLYRIEVSLVRDSEKEAAERTVTVFDSAKSYFGMRKIEFKKDDSGVNRLFLNNKPLFQFGPLDQGWLPDGLYTAPTDEALAYDIEVTKKLGMNMCRKHVKVEPARWYYHCDRLGLLVWQDMPSGDRYIGGRDPDITRSAESEENFRREWQEIVNFVHNHPSVIAYVPFNEGWGQFKTNEILAWTKMLDPTRLVDGPSGWTDRGGGDMHDMHMYPGPGMFPVSDARASVLGEFGGLGLPMEGHLWWNKRNWGYRTYRTQEDLQRNYETLIRNLRPLIARGLAAAVYTQTTDVEGEVNGLMTYDRAKIKLDAERVSALHKKLYEPQQLMVSKPVAPTSEQEGQKWRYTTTRPADGWEKPDFDDSTWQERVGGFGEKSTPGSAVRTTWKTPEIWLRRTIELDGADPAKCHLRVHHDEDAKVYVNGKLVAELAGYTTEYRDVELDERAATAFAKGRNTIAVQCRQTGGGQYIDVGVVEFVPAGKKK